MISGIKSAKLKLARAAKHLRAIKKCVAAYSAGRPHKIVKTAKGKKKLNIPKPPPRAICILAGEMVYQMRSALDHLVFDLLRRNAAKIKLPAKWFRKCEFPLFVTVPTTVPTKGHPPVPHSLPVPHSVFAEALPGISKQAYEFVESVQPYHRKTAIGNCLRFLAELSNIDKHRYLNLIGPRTQQSQSIRFVSGLRSKSNRMLDRGAEIYTESGWDRSDRAAHVHRRYRTSVSFQERTVFGDMTTVPVEYILELILNQINTIIVPEFEKFIKNP